MKILKAILLISAFFAVSLRLLTYENAEFLGETASLFNTIAFISAGVCVLAALIWILIIKKEEKANKDNEAEKDYD